MMSIEQLAKRAYETHIQTVNPQRDGRTVQPWERLDTRYKAGWIAAVTAVRKAIEEV